MTKPEDNTDQNRIARLLVYDSQYSPEKSVEPYHNIINQYDDKKIRINTGIRDGEPIVDDFEKLLQIYVEFTKQKKDYTAERRIIERVLFMFGIKAIMDFEGLDRYPFVTFISAYMYLFNFNPNNMYMFVTTACNLDAMPIIRKSITFAEPLPAKKIADRLKKSMSCMESILKKNNIVDGLPTVYTGNMEKLGEDCIELIPELSQSSLLPIDMLCRLAKYKFYLHILSYISYDM